MNRKWMGLVLAGALFASPVFAKAAVLMPEQATPATLEGEMLALPEGAMPEMPAEAQIAVPAMPEMPQMPADTSAFATLSARGAEQMEQILTADANAFLETAIVGEGAGGAKFAVSPGYASALIASSALQSADPALAAGPGTEAGLHQSAQLFLGELSAYGLGAPISPMRAGFMPQSFLLRAVQSAKAADGGFACDAALLFLTDTAGKRQEGAAYVFARFFSAEKTTLWLCDDLRVVQTLAQLQSIRQNPSLTLSATPAPGEAPQVAAAPMAPIPGEQSLAEQNGLVLASPEELAAMQQAAAPSVAQVVRIIESSSGASVREQPSSKAKRLAIAKPGVDYDFLGVGQTGWVSIRTSDGTMGYVNAKLIEEIPGQDGFERVVAKKTITLHEEPMANSNEVAKVEAGRKYPVISREMGEWVQIRASNGAIGYIHQKNLR